MKLLLVLVGLAVAQKDWLDDFNPESAYLSIISLRRDFEAANQTAPLNDDEDNSSAEAEEMMPPPPPPPPGPPGPPGRGPRPRRPPSPSSDRCGGWGPWEQAKCFWPDEALDKLPPSCAAIPTKTEWPEWMKKFVASKAMEKYNMLIEEYKARGAPPKCGYCARSFECRIRNTTTSSRHFCPMKEVRPLFENDCNDKKACEVSQEKGGCPPPLFLGGGRRQRLQMMIREGNHEEFSNELFKMRMMDEASEGGRQKRQARSPASLFGGPASFMPFEPQFDFPYEARRSGAQGEGAFGPMEYPLGPDNYDGFREGRRGQQGGKRGRGDKRKGDRVEGRRGGQGRRGGPDGEGRPNAFFDANMQRFGPPFGRVPPMMGSGVQAPFMQSDDGLPGGPRQPFMPGRFQPGPGEGPVQPFGQDRAMPPFGQDRPRQPFGGPEGPRPPFGGPRPQFGQDAPRFGGEGPRPAFGQGGPRPPFSDNDQRPPFGAEMQFPPRRPFAQGPERRPFPTGPIDDAPLPQFSPMGDPRGPRGGRQAPYFNGRPIPFQPKPDFGPGMSAAPRFRMMLMMNNRRGMSFPNDAPMLFPRPPFGPRPPPPHHRFLMELFHGTTCATNGKSCLCCCGHYIPNIDTGACEDLKQLLPGIDKMVENVNKENQQKFLRGPQGFKQMRQMKRKFDF